MLDHRRRCDTEAVAIVPARALGGVPVTRVFDRLAAERGLPRILRTDNGPEFCGRAMLTWAHDRNVTLRLIEPVNRIRTRISNRSTGGSAMSVSTSIGSRVCPTPRPLSKPGAASTTRSDRRKG